jgi:hypothetical protein
MTTEDTSVDTETTETPETEEGEVVGTSRTPRVGMHSMLTRDSDMTARPGFRNPSNKRSKAQSRSKNKPKKGLKKRR